MWNEILGALAILAMVVLCANASRLIEALCDRIRYGVQAPADNVDEDLEGGAETPAEPAAKASAKPVAATASKTVPVAKPAAKPAATRNAA
ncbi:hypothetical protein [Amycolatopsis magusensis]|uniref:hypothetical protein n=1 Tax=Amycolatopsis magusensis TaxID=882444 RepID=UPI0037AFB317